MSLREQRRRVILKQQRDIDRRRKILGYKKNSGLNVVGYL